RVVATRVCGSLILSLLVLAGCRRGSETPVVYGTVFLDDKPISFGFVIFYAEGKPVSTTPVSASGYRTNVPAGDVKVCFDVDGMSAAMAGASDELKKKIEERKKKMGTGDYTGPKESAEMRKQLEAMGASGALSKYSAPATTPFVLTVESGEQ